MSKVILEFNLPEERQEADDALAGSQLVCALQEIQNEVFRPARKHGYADEELNKLATSKNGQQLVHLLEKKFIQILEDADLLKFL